MVGIGMLGIALSLLGLLLLRGRNIVRSEQLGKLWLLAIPLPFLGNSFGWLLTEMGRQPWVVNPGENNVYLLTSLGVSDSVSVAYVAISMSVFTLLYTALGVVWIMLLRRYALEGINTKSKVIEYDSNSAEQLKFVY